MNPLTNLKVDAAAVRERLHHLTPKQRAVCDLMVEGLLSREIAERLGVSINTVKTHRNEIFRRMGADSLLDLVRMIDQAKRPEPRLQTELSRAPDAATGLLHVLVVEDNDELRDAMISGIADMGHAVSGVPNGNELDEILNSFVFDIVLLDIGLGEGNRDGFELAQRVRRKARCGVVMVTARGERDARIRALQDGADAYLVKPVDFDELNAVMQSLRRRMGSSAA